MNIRTREAVRYLGYGKHAIDERTLAMIEDSFKELELVANAKFIYRIFERSQSGADEIILNQLHIKSRNLSKNLRNCDSVVLMGVTLGPAVDLLLKKYSVLNMSKAVVVQACAAAYLEEICDSVVDEIEREFDCRGYLRPRFSPGYGDFSILHQKEILEMIDAPRKIGLTMTEASMLVPTKSVTAVIGISKEKTACHKSGCEDCGKTDCAYRRTAL